MKDWKGNRASVRRMLGIKADHTTKGREENDFYATDPKAIILLLQGCSEWMLHKLHFSKSVEIGKISDYTPTPIWECACGNGNLARV